MANEKESQQPSSAEVVLDEGKPGAPSRAPSTRIEPRKPSRRTVAREQRRRRSESKRSRRRRFYMIGGSAIALALIAGLVLPSVGGLGVPAATDRPPVEDRGPLTGTEIDIQPGSLIEPGTEITYTTTPPTSGPRLESAAAWGVHGEQVPDEIIVRNLEQGAVVFNHGLAEESALADLQSFVEGLEGYPGCYIVQPYPGVPDGSVTLTSWGWTHTAELSDKTAMDEFVIDHRNQAPLFLDNNCGPGGDSSAPSSETAQ